MSDQGERGALLKRIAGDDYEGRVPAFILDLSLEALRSVAVSVDAARADIATYGRLEAECLDTLPGFRATAAKPA